MQILTRGFGNVPVVGTALQHANLLQAVLGAQGGATQAGGGNQVLGNASLSLAMKFALVGGSLTTVGAAVVKFGKSISDANRSLAGVNAVVAMSFAISDVRDLFRSMRSAGRRAGPQAEFLTTWGNFMDKLQPILDGFANAVLRVSTGLLKVATFILDHPQIAGLAIGGMVGGLPGAALGAAATSGGWLGYIGKILAGGWAGARIGGLAGPYGAVIGGIGGAGATAYASDKPWNTSGNAGISSGLTEAKKALDEAVAALKANTDALHQNGSQGLLVGDFMSAFARSNTGFVAPAGIHIKQRQPPIHAHAVARPGVARHAAPAAAAMPSDAQMAANASRQAAAAKSVEYLHGRPPPSGLD